MQKNNQSEINNCNLSKKNKHTTTVGGQALIEGLMMLGPKNASIAVRKPNGEIVVENKPPLKKGFFSKIPFLRGSVLLILQLITGMKALIFSAEFQELDENDEPKDTDEKSNDETKDTDKNSDTDTDTNDEIKDTDKTTTDDKENTSKKANDQKDGIADKIDRLLEKIFGNRLKDVVIIFSVILSIGLSVGLFILLPNLIATLLLLPFEGASLTEFSMEVFQRDTQSFGANISRNFLEGIIRIFIFFSYIILVAKISPEIKRVWQYHGAEHKTIHCYENNEDLTVENIRKYTTRHPRCGTSFLFTVMIISILVFSLVPWLGVLYNLLFRILLLPVVAGISYEIFRLIGNKNNKFVNFLKLPGLLFQKFTTAEPDDSMLEVAIVAMENAISGNKDDDKW